MKQIFTSEVPAENPRPGRLSQKHLAAGVIVFFLVIEVYILLFRHIAHQADLELYYRVASKIMEGKVPYRDFALEYPLFAVIPILIPEVLNHLLGGSFITYITLFALQNILLGIGTGLTVLKTGTFDAKSRGYRYALLLLLSLPIFLFRFDPFPTFLSSLAIFLLNRKPVISGFAWLISVAVKLYTLVLFPVLALYYFFSGQLKSGFRQLAGMFLGMLVLAVLLFWVGADHAFDFLNNHVLRGIHLESLAGGIILLFKAAGVAAVETHLDYGAIHLQTSWSPLVLQVIKFATPVLFASTLVYIGLIFHREAKTQGQVSFQTLMSAFTAQLILFIILNKVFSPQYLVWLLPFIPFCDRKTYTIFTATFMLTILIFPGNYFDLILMKTYMVLLLNVRNFFLVWVFLRVLKSLRAQGRFPVL